MRSGRCASFPSRPTSTFASPRRARSISPRWSSRKLRRTVDRAEPFPESREDTRSHPSSKRFLPAISSFQHCQRFALRGARETMTGHGVRGVHVIADPEGKPGSSRAWAPGRIEEGNASRSPWPDGLESASATLTTMTGDGAEARRRPADGRAAGGWAGQNGLQAAGLVALATILPQSPESVDPGELFLPHHKKVHPRFGECATWPEIPVARAGLRVGPHFGRTCTGGRPQAGMHVRSARRGADLVRARFRGSPGAPVARARLGEFPEESWACR
jgi:hypothetical protein